MRDQLFEKELNFQDVLETYRQALDNKNLISTLEVSFIHFPGHNS